MELQGFSWAYLDSLFAYDPITGLIVRKVDRSQAKAGDVVGTVDGKGYLHVSVDKKFIRLHRLAWFLHFGHVPRQVDHRNNNRADNRLDNLRESTQQQNVGNIHAPSHNTSGYKGVSKNSRTGLWHAQIKKHGKQTFLGRDANPHIAALLYNAHAAEHFGEFAKLNLLGSFKQCTTPPANTSN